MLGSRKNSLSHQSVSSLSISLWWDARYASFNGWDAFSCVQSLVEEKMRPVCADTQHGECIVCMFHALVKFYELCCELFALYEQHASHIVCIQATCVYTHIEQLPGLYLFNVFCFSQAAFLLVFIFCVLFVCVSFMSLSAITFMCARCVTSYTFTHFAFSFLSIHL